jgi:hypothetical protein
MTDFTKEEELAQWLEGEISLYLEGRRTSSGNWNKLKKEYKDAWLLLAKKIREREDGILAKTKHTIFRSLTEIERCVSGVQWSECEWNEWKFKIWRELESHFFKGKYGNQLEALSEEASSIASEDDSRKGQQGRETLATNDCLGDKSVNVLQSGLRKSESSASEATSFEDWWFGQCKKNHCVEQMRVTSNLGFWKEKCRQAWHEGKKVKK